MLYYLFEFLETQYNLPGASLFDYLSFRAAVSVIISLIISVVFGKRIIEYLRKRQIGENVRKLGLEGEEKKSGTPTMGGLIIIIGTIIPVLLMSNLENIYIKILLISTIILGIIGFIDDYIKVFRKDKKGLKGKFKIAGQTILGIFVGIMLLTSNDITIVEFSSISDINSIENFQSNEIKSFKTTIPFFKNNELDYALISNAIFNNENIPTRSDVMEKLIPYIREETSKGVQLNHIMRHTVGLFHGQNGSRIWKQYLSKNMCIRDADLQKVNHIMDQVRKTNPVSLER